jgi:protein gp37
LKSWRKVGRKVGEIFVEIFVEIFGKIREFFERIFVRRNKSWHDFCIYTPPPLRLARFLHRKKYLTNIFLYDTPPRWHDSCIVNYRATPYHHA